MQLATFYDHARDMAREEKITMTESLQRVRSLGITQVEVSQNNLLGREDELGHELSYADLGISTIPSYFDFGRDADVEKQALPTLEAARFLGADKMLVIPGFYREEDGPDARGAQRENMAPCLERLAELAAGYGVSLVMEEYDHLLSPISSSEGVLAFLEKCPALSCCFDTGNFRFAGEDELMAYEKLKGRIAHVHLKDRALSPQWGAHAVTGVNGQTLYPCPVGKGAIPIAQVLKRLQSDGYKGACTIEHYGVANMWAALRESVEWLREKGM